MDWVALTQISGIRSQLFRSIQEVVCRRRLQFHKIFTRRPFCRFAGGTLHPRKQTFPHSIAPGNRETILPGNRHIRVICRSAKLPDDLGKISTSSLTAIGNLRVMSLSAMDPDIRYVIHQQIREEITISAAIESGRPHMLIVLSFGSTYIT